MILWTVHRTYWSWCMHKMANYWTCVFCHRDFLYEKESKDYTSSKDHYCIDCAERL